MIQAEPGHRIHRPVVHFYFQFLDTAGTVRIVLPDRRAVVPGAEHKDVAVGHFRDGFAIIPFCQSLEIGTVHQLLRQGLSEGILRLQASLRRDAVGHHRPHQIVPQGQTPFPAQGDGRRIEQARPGGIALGVHLAFDRTPQTVRHPETVGQAHHAQTIRFGREIELVVHQQRIAAYLSAEYPVAAAAGDGGRLADRGGQVVTADLLPHRLRHPQHVRGVIGRQQVAVLRQIVRSFARYQRTVDKRPVRHAVTEQHLRGLGSVDRCIIPAQYDIAYLEDLVYRHAVGRQFPRRGEALGVPGALRSTPAGTDHSCAQ